MRWAKATSTVGPVGSSRKGRKDLDPADDAPAELVELLGRHPQLLVDVAADRVGLEAPGDAYGELDRPLRQDRCPAGGDEGGDDRVEEVPARVPAATTRGQVNIAIRRIR
jgi:hypothetical protein